MLAHESTYCVGVPGGNAEMSLNGLRAILGQVETELYQSEIYGQMLSSIKTLPEDLTKQVQCMVRAVGREAIRLALRKLVRKKPAGLMPSGGQGFSGSTLSVAAPKLQQPPAPPPPNANLNEVVMTAPDHPPTTALAAPPDSPPTHLLNGHITVYPPASMPTTKQLRANMPKKRSKKELAAQSALQAREACLRELGQTIRQVRQEKAWSPYHLHMKTQIPVHQLEALEMGRIDRLPEDIYLRGFIRQVGNTLGLDGNHLAASLPAIETATAVVPSWQQPKTHVGLRLDSMHVYIGYAALMASGIAWVSQQAAPPQVNSAPMPPPVTVEPPTAPAQPSTAKASQKNVSALNGKQSTTMPSNVSPPERSPVR